MSSTKYIIAEQVLMRLYGGMPDTNNPVQPEDVYKALEQKINSLFRLRHLDTTLPSGETLPDAAMIATYEGNTVTAMSNGKSYALLPVTPISLPKNLGIFLVYDPKNPDNPFIPVQRGQGALLKVDSLLNDLIGNISYEPINNKIIFSKDLTKYGITTVTMELGVFDMSRYTITDALPIPANEEERLVNELFAQFAPTAPETGGVNPYTTFGQNQQPATK